MASFTERYHECTKYNPVSIDRLGNADWSRQPPPFKPVEGRSAYGLSSYLPFLQQTLPEAATSLRGIPGVENYRTMKGLAHLLYFTAGITGVLQSENGPVHFRANPSAGGLYPIELYFAVRNWDSLDDGIYMFHPLLCAVVPVCKSNPWPALDAVFADKASVAAADLILLLTGDFQRSAWRYRERAYRRILLDCGSTLANPATHAHLMGLQTRLLGGFIDSGVAELLSIADTTEVPLVAIAIAPELPSTPHSAQQASLPPAKAAAALRPHPSVQVQQNLVERIPEIPIEATDLPMPAPLTEGIALPRSGLSEEDLEDTFLLQAIGRRSTRRFDTDATLPLVDLGALLDLGHRALKREQLSGGHLKTWLVAHRVSGLTDGVYYYQPSTHTLHLHKAGEMIEAMNQVALGQALAGDCSAVLLHTANLDIATRQFGDRAYRYLGIDAGSVGEQLALFSGYYGVGISGVGGYFDDLCNQVCDLAPTEAILYMSAIGIPSI